MRKADIKFHSEGFGQKSNPAINVKVYHYLGTHEVIEKFKCSEKAAEKALEYQFESAQEQFWREAEETVKEIFPSATVYSEGRSSGWLAVHGLRDIETWNAIDLGKWNKLVNWCKIEIKYLTSAEHVLEDIEVNEWFKDGSELYNFIDTKDGQTKVIADMKVEAVRAGFGPVVRK